MPTTRYNIVVPTDLDQRFRAEVARRLGFQKGNLSAAVVEAMEQWIKS